MQKMAGSEFFIYQYRRPAPIYTPIAVTTLSQEVSCLLDSQDNPGDVVQLAQLRPQPSADLGVFRFHQDLDAVLSSDARKMMQLLNGEK